MTDTWRTSILDHPVDTDIDFRRAIAGKLVVAVWAPNQVG